MRWGQQLLLARRLVEAGVDVLTTQPQRPPVRPREQLGRPRGQPSRLRRACSSAPAAYDQAVTALIEDIYARGLDKRVLVVVTGEFGRTPKISYAASTGAGDASAPAGTHAARPRSLAAQLSRTSGPAAASTPAASSAPPTSAAKTSIERVCSPGDFLATIYHHLGIDSATTLIQDFNGRPTPIVDHGKPIPELIG